MSLHPCLLDNLKPLLYQKKILLGITGSIAAFKSIDLIRLLKTCGAEVRVILTQGAEHFIHAHTLETLAGTPIETRDHYRHIELARWADVILIAPCTAHTLAKIAHGFADDLLSTEILVFQGPLWIAPAMNPSMYQHPTVQEHVQILSQRGVQFIGPETGPTACGEEGLGRLTEPDKILEKVATTFWKPHRQQRVLITLGPTRSLIDPVRYITNHSSGWMGASLCWAAHAAGYEVTAICGPISVPLPERTEKILVQTTETMIEQTLEIWKTSSDLSIFIGAAAILDWTIENPCTTKLKKTNGTPQLQWKESPDLLQTVSQMKKPGQFILGFAAESDHLLEEGLKKLKTKQCDAIFANPLPIGCSPLNEGIFIHRSEEVISFQPMNKARLAEQIFQQIENSLKTL